MDMMMYTYDYYIRGATTTFSAVHRFASHLFHYKFLKVCLFYFPPTVHNYTPSTVVLSITLVILKTEVHSTCDSLSRVVHQGAGHANGNHLPCPAEH